MKTKTKGLIFNLQKFSLHDGPGIRTVIFFKGCPLRCIWCCNPESQIKDFEIGYNQKKCIFCKKCLKICPNNAIRFDRGKIFYSKKLCNLCLNCINVCPTGALAVFGKKLDINEVLSEIKKDLDFYRNSGGGITLSGGEALVQSEFAKELLYECQKLKINTAIETCGYIDWKNIKKVLPFTDLFIFDIKHFDPGKHKLLTGASNKIIFNNLTKLSKTNKEIIIRIPIIPDYNSDVNNINNIANFLKTLKNIKYIEFMPYHNLGNYKYKMLNKKYVGRQIKVPTKKELINLGDIIKISNIELKKSN